MLQNIKNAFFQKEHFFDEMHYNAPKATLLDKIKDNKFDSYMIL